jgi:hypothetical protein
MMKEKGKVVKGVGDWVWCVIFRFAMISGQPTIIVESGSPDEQ